MTISAVEAIIFIERALQQPSLRPLVRGSLDTGIRLTNF